MTRQERRGAPRIFFQSRIIISTADRDTTATADSRDISLKGIYVQAEKQLPVGTLCTLKIDLSGSSSNLSFRVRGKVCRHDDKGMGIAFYDLDQDTFVHLKNLIRLHGKKNCNQL